MAQALYKVLLFLSIIFIFSFDVSCQENIKTSMRNAINNKDYNYALDLYNTCINQDEEDCDILRALVCEIYYIQGNYKQAEKLSKTLYNEDEATDITNLIYACLLSQDIQKNEQLIAQIIEDMGDKTLDKYLLLQMQFLKKDHINKLIRAIDNYILKENINNQQEKKPYKTMLTVFYYYVEKYMEAYNTSIDYLTMDNQPIIYYILGVLREKRQEYFSAITFFDLAIKKGYNHYDAYLQRAICKGFTNDYIGANIDLDTCMIIDSNYYVFYLKGINYNFLQDYQSAMYCLDYSITLNDTFSNSYNYRGVVESNLKEYEFAIKDFRQAIFFDKKTPFVYNNLGIALEKTGKLQQAIEQYEKSIKMEPNLADAYYNLGRIYTNEKQTKKAIKYLEQSLQLDEQIPDTYYLLGINYQLKGNKTTACQMYNIALEMGHTLVQGKIDEYCNQE